MSDMSSRHGPQPARRAAEPGSLPSARAADVPLFDISVSWETLLRGAQKLCQGGAAGGAEVPFEDRSPVMQFSALRGALARFVRRAAVTGLERELSKGLTRATLKRTKDSPVIDTQPRDFIAVAIDDIAQNFFEYQLLGLTSAEKAISVVSGMPGGIAEAERRVRAATAAGEVRISAGIANGDLFVSTSGGSPAPSDLPERLVEAASEGEEPPTSLAAELLLQGDITDEQIESFLNGGSDLDYGGRGLRTIAAVFKRLDVDGNRLVYSVSMVDVLEEGHSRMIERSA